MSQNGSPEGATETFWRETQQPVSPTCTKTKTRLTSSWTKSLAAMSSSHQRGVNFRFLWSDLGLFHVSYVKELLELSFSQIQIWTVASGHLGDALLKGSASITPCERGVAENFVVSPVSAIFGWRWGTTCTRHQFMAGPTEKDKQLSALTFTRMDNLWSIIYLFIYLFSLQLT